MADINTSFRKEKEAFLKRNIFLGAARPDVLPNKSGVYYFNIQKSASFSGCLEIVECQKSDVITAIQAYWLPWAPGKILSIDAAGEANYFFTSQLTGCQFRATALNKKTVKMMHVAGDISAIGETTKTRNDEVEKLLDADQWKRSRALSISLAPGKQGDWGRVGYGGDASWCNVFGFRKHGSWKIWYQTYERDPEKKTPKLLVDKLSYAI